MTDLTVTIPYFFLYMKKRGVKFGTYYLSDQAATSFTYHIAEVTHESLQMDKAKTTFYSVLNGGSTDSIEQELIYVLFFNESIPTLK